MRAGIAVRPPGAHPPDKRLDVCLLDDYQPSITGTSRYVEQLTANLRQVGVRVERCSTQPGGAMRTVLNAGRVFRLDLPTFFTTFPVRLRWPRADLYHLTTQTYAGVLVLSPPPGPVVVTVHDIIPYLLRNSRTLTHYTHAAHRIFDGLAMHGLRRAQALLADSEYTSHCLQSELGIPASRIHVVPLAVDHERFRPKTSDMNWRDKYRVPEVPFMLYVGSEQPRKNVPTLLRALEVVHRTRRDVCLVKVGSPQHGSARGELLALAAGLGVLDNVIWIDNIADDDLPLLYNAAAVFVSASVYEGFGLPIVEAMACGTPVVCANTAAFSEVAGDAALLVPAQDPCAFARAILSVLDNPGVRNHMSASGLRQSAGFTWHRTAVETAAAYGEVTQTAYDPTR
ncbi:MAG: glycosyltransferase family 4 protein [Chloroflexi bacterium]|nr:glycosyltransferase family 4 protein [Chloroflexota bacterium]